MRFKFLSIIILFVVFFNTIVFAEVENIVQNFGFEEVSGQGATIWNENIWDKSSGVSKIMVDETEKRSGSRSVCITNNSGNDARLEQEIKVKKNSLYRLSCWIKTEGIGEKNKGANLSVSGILDTTKDIKGTNGKWEYVQMYGETGKNQKSFFVTIGVGGYSSTNIGKAWFDDVVVEMVNELPEGTKAAKLFIENNHQESTPNNVAQGEKKSVYGNEMLIYMFIYIIVLIMAYFVISRSKKSINRIYARNCLYILLFIGFVMRVFLSTTVEGMPNDIACFKAWASAAAHDLPGIYRSGMFLDYPPFYLYVLYIVGKIASFGLGINYTLLVKLPPIIADVVTAWLIYSLSLKYAKKELSLLIAAAFIFNPAIILNSTLWGMVDSFFTLLIIASLLFIIKDKVEYATIFMAMAILMKPQGIFFIPILLYEVIKKRSFKKIVLCFVFGLATTLLIILPFSIGQDILWIFKLYLKTAGGYTAASLNAYNLFSFLGANLKQDSSILFLFSYKTWGLFFDVIIVLFSGYLYIKGKHFATPIVVAIFLNFGAFILSTRMHERYMYPVVALSLLLFAIMENKRIAILFISFTSIVFLNTHDVLYRSLNYGSPHIPAENFQLIFMSLINILAFAYFVEFSISTFLTSNLNFQKSRSK